MTPDLILVEGLELKSRVGVPAEERAKPQRLTVNLALEPLARFAEAGDQIDRTVDYFAVTRAIQALAATGERRLIETLIEEIAQLALTRFDVRAVEVELRKYILPDTQYVAVRIRRERA